MTLRSPSPDGPIEIAICLDDKLLLAAAVLLRSIAENTSTTRAVRVHALTTFDIEDLRALAPGDGFPNFELAAVRVDDRFADLPRNSYISQATYLRFLLPDLLPATERLIYLDIDMIAHGDLGPLWSMDLGDAYLAATHDIAMRLGSTRWDRFELPYEGNHWSFADYQREIVELPDGDTYFNAGLLVLDLPSWRRDEIAQRTLDFLGRKRSLKFMDQDALNHVVQGAYVRLDPRWNAMANCLDRQPDRRFKTIFSADGRRWEHQRRQWEDDPWIIHYAGPNKPWRTTRPVVLGEIWWDYARRSAAWPQLQGSHAAFEAAMRRRPAWKSASVLDFFRGVA